MSSKADIWMPLYIGDYLADTADLSTEQHGTYLLLLMHEWRGGPFIEDLDALCRVCRLSASSTAQALLKQVLSRFFTRQDDGLEVRWFQGRLETERVKWSEKKRVYTERASKGGKAKAASSIASSSASSTRKAVLGECTLPSPSYAPPVLLPDSVLYGKSKHHQKPKPLRSGGFEAGAGRSARTVNDSEEFSVMEYAQS